MENCFRYSKKNTAIFLLCLAVFFVFISFTAFADSIIEGALNISADKIAGPYYKIVATCVEPYLGIMIIGICENVNSFFGSPLDIQTTLAGNPVILTIVTVMFVLTKILKSNSGTKIFGMVTLGEIEKKLSVIFPIILGVINIYMIIKYGYYENNSIFAADNILMIIFTIFLSVLSFAVCFIIKTVVTCIEILELPLGIIPGFSFMCEVLKSLFVIFLLWISAINPVAGMIINIIVIFISIAIFRKSYDVVKYYKSIYLAPFLCKIGIKKKYNDKIEYRVLKYTDIKNIDYILPVFSGKRNRQFKKYQSFYLIKKGNQIYLFKDAFLKRNIVLINLKYEYGNTIFIQNKIKYIEIFSLFDIRQCICTNYKKINKDMSFVFSKEYKNEYNNIVNSTHFVDFDEFKKRSVDK